jgi:predicted GIY-YIG superfamily endonuclease
VPFAYLLRCADGSLYAGWTTDLERRVAAHNDGTGARYTRARRPVELAWWAPLPDRSTAMREEALLKRLPRAAKLERVAHTERSAFAACVAHVTGAAPSDVPLDADELRAWLGERGLGLVPVADPASFAWAGPWIARRPARDSGEPRAVVMFGVPSGPVWDPAGTTDERLDGVVVAPLDLAVWPPQRGPVGEGVVEALVLAPAAEAPVVEVEEAVAVAGLGLEGDRYALGTGTFGSGRPGSALTLVDAAVLDEHPGLDHRRNVVVRGTDLNALVGREFALGEVRCRGRRLAEPCAHLDRLNGGGVLRPLVHRAGLRADVLSGGRIRVGDSLVPG